jgi:nucleoside-diphosphate-sugar epimerase
MEGSLASKTENATDIDKESALILVTGGGGFIGGHLVASLRRRGFRRIRAVDIKPLAEWCQVFEGVENIAGSDGDCSRIEVCQAVAKSARDIYQLAADMGGMGFIENNKALCMLTVLINTHMLMAARDQGAKRFFYSSSACVYNADKQRDPRVTALKEEDAYPAMPEDGYGWEKLFSERMCRHFHQDFGLDTRVARFHNVYGSQGTWEGGREKAPAAICRKVIAAKVSGRHEIEIWGDGTQTRSFMYIDDCLEGINRLLNSDVIEPINIGSSELVSINQLVDIAESIAGIKLQRHYKLDAPRGVAGRNSDNTRILAKLGWQPSTSLAVGIARTYEWICDEFARKYDAKSAADAMISNTKQSAPTGAGSTTH